MINWTCRSCRFCHDPNTDCQTWCDRFYNEYGARIILFAHDLDTKLCDSWQPRPTTTAEEKKIFRSECKAMGFEPTSVACTNNVIYGWFLDSQVKRMLDLWCSNPELVPEVRGITQSSGPLPRICSDYGITAEVPVFVVFDNEGGDFLMEEYFSRDLALKWIIDCADPWELSKADDMYIKNLMSKKGGIE